MIGTTIDETYKVLDELARDDRSVTYLAKMVATNEIVDLKFVTLAVDDGREQEALARFQREVTLLGSLHDNHIARLYKHGEYGGQHYMVFEHLPGISLRAAIRQSCAHRQGSACCLNEEQALRIAKQITRGLAHAHENGVIHRALCPEAIIVNNDGLVKITDFRFAKKQDSSDITSVGHQVGRLTAYTAPEQTGGDATLAADIYAVGAVMYEMLTGIPPTPSDMDPLQRQLLGSRATIEQPRAYLPTLSLATEALVMRCLSGTPSERPASATALLDLIAELLPQADKTDSGPLSSGGDAVLAALVENVSQWRDYAPPGRPATSTISPTRPRSRQRSPSPNEHAWVETSDGRVFQLDKTEIRVGRESRAQDIIPDISFDERWVHRRYVRLDFRGTTWYLCEEAGARNGTFLNGVELKPDEERRLSDGDVVTLGRGDRTLSFTFHCRA